MKATLPALALAILTSSLLAAPTASADPFCPADIPEEVCEGVAFTHVMCLPTPTCVVLVVCAGGVDTSSAGAACTVVVRLEECGADAACPALLRPGCAACASADASPPRFSSASGP